MLALAKETANKIAANHPEVTRVLLFGSFAREDFTSHSDMDLLLVLKYSDKPIRERITAFLDDCSTYPTDLFPLTEAELQSKLESGDPFWSRAVHEGIQCYPAD